MVNKKSLLTPLLLVVLVAALVAITGMIGDRLIERIATMLCISLVVVLGLQVFMGNSGILSFAHVGFMGIGAYSSAVLSMPSRMKGMALPDLYPVLQAVELSPFVAIVVGALLAALVAAAISYPLMRLSDAAAVITSFALLVVLHTIMVHWSAVTNGPRTLFGVPKATTLYVAGGSAILAIAVAFAFKESRTGLLLRAVRDDETAAAALGAHVSALRWRGFVLGALLAGLGGGLWGHFITSFAPGAFYLKETFVILGMLVIGGATTVTGAVIGTFVVSLSFEALRALEANLNAAQIFPGQIVGLTEIVLALAMIGILILRPGGLFSTAEIGTLITRRRRSRPVKTEEVTP